MVILITGANGQLGIALRKKATDFPQHRFIFLGSENLDITNAEECLDVFYRFRPDYCINTAAYTAVDKAEVEPDEARRINARGVANLVKACEQYQTTLIQISTDFVFDGSKKSPYTETDLPSPINIYGQTKWEGEQQAQQYKKHYVFRTSWLYSDYGENFKKKMLKLASERKELSVVDDQVGSPTQADGLAKILLKLIDNDPKKYGLYHYSDSGSCTWYIFAKTIFEVYNQSIRLKPVSTADYPTLAKRPRYSVLNTDKITKILGVNIRNWEEALRSNA